MNLTEQEIAVMLRALTRHLEHHQRLSIAPGDISDQEAQLTRALIARVKQL